MDRVIITKDYLDMGSLRNNLPSHPCCGALVQFEGIVRDHNEGKKVLGIEYECFEKMAQKELEKIIEESKTKWPVHEVFLVHRIGRLDIKETSLILFVISPHRREAFEASQYIIDALKERVPIWKKEFYEDGKAEWTRCRH